MPGDEFFTVEFEPEVEWSTVLAHLTLLYGADRSNPRWKDIAGMAKARGVVIGSYRKESGFSRAEIAHTLGLSEQLVFCSEHGLAVDRSGPLFDRDDRFSLLEGLQLEIRDQLGVTDIELFNKLVRQAFLELDDNE